MEGKVAVLGNADFVMPFAALGLDTYPVGDNAGEIEKSARSIIETGYVLVVVAENIAAGAEQYFADVRSQPVPCVVIVPFTTEPEGFATQALGRVLKMATGIDILENN